jgi:ATP-binding cassette, subfamily B, multidrug efflux pump
VSNEDKPAAPPPRPMMRGPMGMNMGPPQKAKTFTASAKRLLGMLRPEKPLIIAVLGFAIGAVALSVSGPKVMARATNIIFRGFFGGQAHPNASPELMKTMHVDAGHGGIDFDALFDVLVLTIGLYIGASILMWLQG